MLLCCKALQHTVTHMSTWPIGQAADCQAVRLRQAHLVLDAGLLLAGVAVLALPPALAAHFSCMRPRPASVVHSSAAVEP
jgi:hypothetical protein